MNNLEIIFSINPSLKIEERDMYDFKNSVILKDIEPGTTLLEPGDACQYLPFVVEGDLKIHRISENGREIVLYHLAKGESCILSALGIINNTLFPASAIVPTGGKIILIPDRLIKKYLDKYPGWRNYIFSLYNDRFHLILELVDEILFRKIDVRLARFLLNHCNENSLIKKYTHQLLSEELHTSREVVSRLLKSLSDREILTYHRNEIHIINKKELTNIASL